MAFVSSSSWTNEITGTTTLIVCFKNIGKSSIKELKIQLSIEDEEVIEYEDEISFCGILEPGQYYTESILILDGLDLSNKAKILYSFDYETIEEKNPSILLSNLKLEKTDYSTKLRGQITNKSKKDYHLYIYVSFFNNEGTKLSICCIDNTEVKAFKAGKTYSFTTEAYRDESKINHYELSYCFMTTETFASIKSALSADKSAEMSLRSKLLGMFW